ncbi:keratin-like protein [Roseimaritima sediminicola]|uniref:keratin-like protein n=1 Tax=Roseimaritima sediminicola TaxID=2662066 RepID=UPI0012983ED4|nr:keratin-like protein [Roseimaritima sediminicola]
MRVLAPVLLAAAMIIGSSANASAFGLFGHHFGSGCDSCCDAPACEPVCGCEVAPACGCEVDPCCPPKRSLCDRLKGIFSKKHSHHDCCEPACGCEVYSEPACGCEVAAPCYAEPACGCEPVCAPKKGCGLFDKLFGKRHHHHDCCEPVCGCEPTCGF